MPGASVYPSSLDNFAEASPTNLGDNDATGRTHAERHDDIEAAVEALQARVVTTVGTFAEASPTFLGDDDSSGRTHSERHNDIATAVLALQAAVGFTAGTFATTSPTNLADNDSSGRTHSERHDDIETAVEALETFIGVTPTADVPVMLAGAALYLDAEYHEGSETVFNRGTAGYALNALNGGGTAITSNDAKWLPYSATDGPYVYLPGVASNYLSTPDAAALDITGDLTVCARAALDDWTPASIMALSSKFRTSTADRSWEFRVQTTGTIELITSADGATYFTHTSTAAPSLTDGATYWLAATIDVDNGAVGHDVRFFYAADSATVPTSWTQIGTTVTTAGVTSLYSSVADVMVGSTLPGGTTRNAAGSFYRAIVASGIGASGVPGGTTVLDVDTSVITSGAATSFTATTGQTVTINRSTSGRKAVAVVGNCWLLGTDDYMEVADNALLDFGASDSFTVLAVVRQWATPTSYPCYAAKRLVGDGSAAGWGLAGGNADSTVHLYMGDGTDFVDPASSSVTAGALSVIGGQVNRTAVTARTFVNGTLAATTSTTALGDMTNSRSLLIGSSAYADMELTAVAVFRSALTAAQISAISTYFASR